MSTITQGTASTFDQALNHAIEQALRSYPWSDAQINWKITNVVGISGGAVNGSSNSSGNMSADAGARVTIQIAHSLSRAYLEAQAVELEEELAA